MLFNSLEFFLFLPVVFLLYWFVFHRSLRAQNLLVLVASYFFYGWWDWRFLGLIFLSSMVDYVLGLALHGQEDARRRKWLLAASMGFNLGLLGFFKYFNFFADSLATALASVGVQANPTTLDVLLPVGISFYTFQTMSYTLDVYKRQLEPTRDLVSFLAFVSFFPQLVAGPIERASALLPQFLRPRSFDQAQARDGMRQILWGLFKKVVVADNAAEQANWVFSNHQALSSPMLWWGIFCFAFQIYGDFSGYSDIAIGTARLFGFQLMRNFAFPYFSRDIGEFWRRWHISLSTWFRDYLYIPLGGSRAGKLARIRNIVITFTVSGFWHGANWTFVVWGFLNGLYYIPLMLREKHKQNTDDPAEGRLLPGPRELFQIGSTFALTLVAWVFFRARSMGEALAYLAGMFDPRRFLGDVVNHDNAPRVLLFIAFAVGVEWLQRKKQHGLQIDALPVWFRWPVYYALAIAVMLFFGQEKEFIYFQF